MNKSGAGLFACAVVAFALTVTSAHALPRDSSQQGTSTSSGPSSGPGGSSTTGGDSSGPGSTGGSSHDGYPETSAPQPPETPPSPTAPTTTPTDPSTPPSEPAPSTEPSTPPASGDPAPTSEPPPTTNPTDPANPDAQTDKSGGDHGGDQSDADDPPPDAQPPEPAPAAAPPAGPRFLVRARASMIDDLLSRHRLTRIAVVHQTTPTAPEDIEQVVLIAGPEDMSADAIDQEMDADPDILACEQDKPLALPEVAGAATTASADAISQTLATQTVTSFYGVDAPSTYVAQPASAIINLPGVRATNTGTGIVAVIDTGVDATHPLLGPSVTPGYDFTREQAGTASDLLDLDQSTAAILEQSTAAILEQNHVVVVNQSTAAILEQSTAAILEGLPALPAAFGHGTMVAGLVHLTAPTATILPLKAFTAGGTSTVATVVRAIYYAVEHGARVINMSFSVGESSPELMKAINYATSHRVTCVAASGNQGVETLVYPAAYRNVVAVASTNNLDQRSLFSNFGDADVTVAAPGESVTTTFPGGHYASASGTSFSAAFVSGAVALMLQDASLLTPRDALDNLTHAAKTTPRLGYGRLDLLRVLRKDQH